MTAIKVIARKTLTKRTRRFKSIRLCAKTYDISVNKLCRLISTGILLQQGNDKILFKLSDSARLEIVETVSKEGDINARRYRIREKPIKSESETDDFANSDTATSSIDNAGISYDK